MTKNNVRIKANITMEDKVNAIEGIVYTYFVKGKYTPYYARIGEITAIATYFMEGLEFEEDENIYNSIVSDDEIMKQIGIFYNNTSNAGKIMSYVKEQVADKVDFMKQQIIHSHADMDKIIKVCNVVIDSLENFSKLDLTQMTKEDMELSLNVLRMLGEKDFTADDLSEAIKNAVAFDIDKASAEIIEAKNAEIRELKKYKALWESQIVMNDKVVAMPTKG